jgi:hypothetical protein
LKAIQSPTAERPDAILFEPLGSHCIAASSSCCGSRRNGMGRSKPRCRLPSRIPTCQSRASLFS